MGSEERPHFIDEGDEGGLVCLQDVVGAVEGDEPAAGHQCVEILGLGEGERLVAAAVQNQGWQVEAAGYTALESGTTLVIRVGAGQKGPQVQEIVSVDASTAEPEPPRGARAPRPMRSGGPGQSGGGFGRPSGGPSARPVSGPPEVPATVKWFDSVKGYGFVSVEGESKDLFLHISVVERAGLGQLEQGQAVRVAIVEGRKGPEVGAIELA